MIEVQYDRGGRSLTVSGHAGAGEKGADVVCAGVSTLVFTLLHELIRLGAEHERELKPGFARVCCSDCGEVFDCVATGLMLMAERYPRYVSFQERDVQWPSPTI